METLTATVRDGSEGERRWFCGGGLHTWKATEAETGGAFLIFEDHLELGKSTPLHRHPTVDETFYMLEGDVLLNIAGEERPLGPGGIAIIPRGVPHAFLVTSETARMLCLQTPGSGEAFYRGASDPVVEGSAPPGIDFERVASSARATGAIEILGPPPFAGSAQPTRSTGP